MVKLGQSPYFHEDVKAQECTFGYAVEVGARTKINNSSMGDFSYVGNDSDIINTTIGKFCSIAAHTRINPGNHPMERAAMHHFTYRSAMYNLGEDDPEFFEWRKSKPVTVGHDIWMGHGATILAGVSIGNGAVIGAGAVVSKNVADFEIVGGVPAKPIRKRFPEAVIKGLNQLAWWDWSTELLEQRMEDFRNLDAESFLEKYL